MIKLLRPDKPVELTEEAEKKLIEEFKETGKPVWRKLFIINLLLEMSHNKCCYCETLLGTQARAMQVDHFHYKEKYPDEVVSWKNLLPSCSQCNSNKNTIDTKEVPFIDPTEDAPTDYLYLKNFYIRSKDNTIGSKGRRTVDELELNHRDRLVNPRIKIADEMQKSLLSTHKKAIALEERDDGKLYNGNKIINTLRDILKMAQPEAEYSAFMATIILTEEDYVETKSILESKGLWNSELESLHNAAEKIKLDTSI